MRIEKLPGLETVVRFPVERRARSTLALLRDIAPDVREVLAIAAAFGLAAPEPGLRDRVDAEMAEYILEQFGGNAAKLPQMLDELLNPVVTKAVAACRAAHDLSIDAVAAQQALLQARTEGHIGFAPLRERADALTQRTAELLIEAHIRVEKAEGAGRPVGLARRGEPWAPRDHRAEEEALFGPVARRAG